MNLIDLAMEIEERYRRYLRTTFHFKDPDLRLSFEEELNNGQLSRGPYLEATPTYQSGDTPAKLFPEILGFQPDAGFLEAMNGTRPLYLHQEMVLRKLAAGKNIVLATGTGSGKTEAFLYPILLHLYRQFKEGELGPGVRALILYPMNALANDQRGRIREYAESIRKCDSSFRFTFGQYIGETPHLRGHTTVRKVNYDHGELLYREEMQAAPPHILLTNYSMLEYLLLRPEDSPLFDNGRARHWTFLVLDEAHQYRGAKGAEMAMLLRRLKQRLREGGYKGEFRCIATSATLASGKDGQATVAKFAADLFGEEFTEDGVILGATVPLPAPSPRGLGADDYEFLYQVLIQTEGQPTREESNRLEGLASLFGIDPKTFLPDLICRLLQADGRATDLRQRITTAPADFNELAAALFPELPESQGRSALSRLVELLLAVKDSHGTPLLSARYHLFLRALDGAWLTFWPHKRVLLNRRAEPEDGAVFELALCRDCGQHYLVGPRIIKEGKLGEAVRDPSDESFGASYLRPLDDEADLEDEAERKTYLLCIRCGEITRTQVPCDHGTYIRVIEEPHPKDEDKADQISRCGVCGYHASGHDPVREIVHGADGPHAVIATTLCQRLPETKKVLAFADGRQEAAFFAWYLDQTYKDILERNLLLKAMIFLSELSPSGANLSELAKTYREIALQRGVYPTNIGVVDLYELAWKAVYREFLTEETRIALEGVGLIQWFVDWPGWEQLVNYFAEEPWSLSPEETCTLVSWLLDTLRLDKAIELKTDHRLTIYWNDLGLRAPQRCVKTGRKRIENESRDLIRSWDGQRGRRADFLAKILRFTGLAPDDTKRYAQKALEKIWNEIRTWDDRQLNPAERLLVMVEDACRANPDWWRVRIITEKDRLYRCSDCGILTTISIRKTCPRPRCSGLLKDADPEVLRMNHYRLLYEDDLPGYLRVEEHTAQLEHEIAAKFQEDFRLGRINVLSCSTTFELGVDLGDLNTIFLRNVPPETFNYAQRVGRTGRRSGKPGLAVTYCRRSPHDLYHFSNPTAILMGKIRPPVMTLRNAKIILRHMTALVLSSFFRMYPDRATQVHALLGDMLHPSATRDLRKYLQDYSIQLTEALKAVVPLEMAGALGLLDGSWIEKIAGPESSLALAESEVAGEYQAIMEYRESAYRKGEDKNVAWAGDRINTIRSERVVNFLSRKAVIPKYGFPVDVVELDTQRKSKGHEAMEICLQRDLSLAISEFAPTSELIANKTLWTSYGLKRVPNREWVRWWYARCKACNFFERKEWRKGEAPPFFKQCCPKMTQSQYIEPIFGFITARTKPEEPRQRPVRAFTSRPYFAGFQDPHDTVNLGPLAVRTVSPGYLVVLCEGKRSEGFRICRQCGAGFRIPKIPHKTPYGETCECKEELDPVALGHEILTDVLELRFLIPPEPDVIPIWFGFSLAFALVEGAACAVLEVPSTDLGATVAHSDGNEIPPIILYDKVPGGAGLVASLQEKENLKAALVAAYERVAKCGCAEDGSCYGCLRNYWNQFAHQHLARGPVKHYLEKIIRLL